MQGIEYVYELCEELPRCGPGDIEHTRRAFHAMPLRAEHPFILDIGCGTGAQTIVLAKISNGKIIALDNHQAFLDILMERAKSQGVEEKISPKNISMLEMDFDAETFDVIWSEGALYCMGFQNGLRRCHGLLKHRGFMAVTELVYTSSDPPDILSQYLDNEYPDIKIIEKNIELIQKENFTLLLHFTLPESAWLYNYYVPIEKELPRLIKKYQGNEIALGVFQGFKNEIDFYRNYSHYYGYEFFVMQKAH
jgi:ubiquinone/menaquinone biosynthesis C-methylase UbiE